MPKGLKETSSVIVISADITESAANTFTSQTVDLQLDVLNQEVFIVYAVDLDMENPTLVPGQDTTARMSLSTTQRTSVGGLADSNVMAVSRQIIQSAGGESIVTSYASDNTPNSQLEYIGIIATNDFVLHIQGTNNPSPLFGQARVWGVRARADAATFAALTQSELLSA